MSERPLTIAVPKGRVLKQLVPYLEGAGVDIAPLVAKTRKLVRETTIFDAAVRFLLLKPDDVPTYVEYGAADLGVVGRDVLLERAYDVYAPLDLPIGRCILAVAGTPDSCLRRDDGGVLRVATKFPTVATRHFTARGEPFELIFVQGSVELAPITGLADVIVDIVETGETLRSNGLHVMEEICDVSSMVIVNRVALKLRDAAIRPLLEALNAAPK